MNLERLACGNCGASLQVPEGVKFVSCLHCGSSLQVRYNNSVAYTEVIEKLEEHASLIANLQEQVRQQSEFQEQLQLEQELQALDQRWQMESESLMKQDKYGNRSPPSKVEAFFMAAFGGTVGVTCLMYAAENQSRSSTVASPQGQSGMMVLFGLGTLLLFGAMAFVQYYSAKRYERLQHEYMQQRANILSHMSHSNPLSLKGTHSDETS